MSVRRSRIALPHARGIGLAAVLLLLAPLAACTDDTNAAVQPASGSPTASVVPRTAPAPDTTKTPAPGRNAGSQRPRPGKKVLEGGGFAKAVPGSDAPDRKVDVGPQYAVSADLDIREIERLVKAVERIARAQRVEQPLATGGSVAAAVGTFSYRWFADGTVAPDPDWVAASIRYGEVPILGTVQCHRAVFPQLRGALREIVARGLADEIHADEYGGCYVPRFIGRDPKQGLSLHTWGIALDLNVPGNQRGVAGEIDRDVVAIFKKWGFAWGGDWAWTDPMHFELAQIVRER
ncbi:MAG TPA: M15 family metallopeptidase [Nocardioidaceae bacterium]|nr:M15 family metallopeptidase [Nocardioidaceae bacterium]